MFWIHLNVDYPFNLTGVLYFPKLKKDFDLQKNKIQLYSRQVFITDEVDNLLPRYLRFVAGVVDSEDLQLNVSRETLQDNPQVRQIRKSLVKKVQSTLKGILGGFDAVPLGDEALSLALGVAVGLAQEFGSERGEASA